MNEVASLGFSIGEQGSTAGGYLAGLGTEVGMTNDDGFTVDVDGRVLPEDPPPDAGDEVTGQPDVTAPVPPVADGAIEVAVGADVALVHPEDGGEVAPITDELFAPDAIAAATVVVEVPDESAAPFAAPDTEFARDVADADDLADAADDVWNDVG